MLTERVATGLNLVIAEGQKLIAFRQLASRKLAEDDGIRKPGMAGPPPSDWTASVLIDETQREWGDILQHGTQVEVGLTETAAVVSLLEDALREAGGLTKSWRPEVRSGNYFDGLCRILTAAVCSRLRPWSVPDSHEPPVVTAAAIAHAADRLVGELRVMVTPCAVAYCIAERLSLARFYQHAPTHVPALIGRYPLLFYLAAEFVLVQIERLGDLLRYFQIDRAEIAARFGTGLTLTAIEPLWSDPHYGQRTVARVEINNGTVLAYKPRASDDYLAFRATYEAVVSHISPPLMVQLPDLLSKPSRTWMNWVGSVPCEGRTAWDVAGVLAAVAYLMNLTDLHRGNIVWSEGHPVVVDAECMYTPIPDLDGRAVTPLYWGFGAVKSQTLCSSDLIHPCNLNSPIQNEAGFGPAPTGFDPGVPLYTYTNGRFRIASGSRRLSRRKTGRTVGFPRADDVQEMRRGFELAYRAMLAPKCRRKLMGIRDTIHFNPRLVVRDTYSYARLVYTAFQPECMASAKSFISYLADGLSNTPYHYLIRPEAAPLLVLSELLQLSSLDIPLFQMDVRSRSILVSGRVYSLDSPNLSGLRFDRIELLSPRDLATQLRVLDLIGSTDQVFAPQQPDVRDTVAVTPDPSQALPHLLEFVHKLLAHDHQPYLHFLPDDAKGSTFRLHFASPGAYSGLGGLLLAFSGYLDRFGFPELEDGQSKILNLMGEWLPVWLGQPTTGLGFDGAAGVLAGLATARHYQHRPEFDGLAKLCTKLMVNHLATGHITSNPDFMGGEAGAILGLYAVNSHGWACEGLPATAVHSLAQSLSDRAVVTADGLVVWRTTHRNRYNLGFAHGSAGIALSLAAAYRLTGEVRFRDLAIQTFEALVRYCCVPREESSRHQMSRQLPIRPVSDLRTWCHGTSGIALAIHSARSNFALDIPDGMAIFSSHQNGQINDLDDTLCCGIGGPLTLSIARLRTGQPALSEHTALCSRLTNCVSSAFLMQRRTRLGFWAAPGLFQGMSGHAHLLLHLANPSRYSSPLLAWIG